MSGLFPYWFDSGYMFLRRVEFLRFSTRKELGSRGPCRVLFTPGSQDDFHEPLVSSSQPPVHDGLWTNSTHFPREWGACSSCATPGSTADVCSASVWVLLTGGTRILRSIFCPALRLKWPRSSSTTAVASAMLVLLIAIRLVLCSLRLSAGLYYGAVCTVDASVAVFALGPLYLTHR